MKILQKTTPTKLSILFAEAIRAQSEAEHEVMNQANIPTCPDTSLLLSDDAGLNGWSAKMFLHQMMLLSYPVWSCLDTEQLLSELMPIRLRVNVGKGILLSDVIKLPENVSQECYRTQKMVQGLIRRALARGRSFRLLLRTEQDTIPVIVTFTTAIYESWTVTSEQPLPDSLKNGLMDTLKPVLQE